MASDDGLAVWLHQANVGNPGDCQRFWSKDSLGTPEDVAEAVRYLVSDEAHYLTGTLIPVAGGLLMM